jgi:PadR family transcriptional regulator, regulatory protein PadR
MLKEKLVKAEWELSQTNRRVRTYQIATSGTRYLEREVFSFGHMLKGIYLVLSPAES